MRANRLRTYRANRTPRPIATAPCAAVALLLATTGGAIGAPENAAAPDNVRAPARVETRSVPYDPAIDQRTGPSIDRPIASPIDTSVAPAAPGRRTATRDGVDGGSGEPGRTVRAGPEAVGELPPDPVRGTGCIAADPALASFAEEFDLPLDVSAWGPDTRWIAHTPWKGDFGEARFLDPDPADPTDGRPFAVEHGILTIEAARDEGGRWGSGLLASVDPQGNGFSQLYGYFEARMRLPVGPGVWPAFWLIGLDRGTSTAEIDVMEFRGAKPDGYTSSLHVWNRGAKPNDRQWERHVVFGGGEQGGARFDRFNAYGVHVGPIRTTFYFNRCPVWSAETRPEHRQPVFMLVNLALGGSFPIDETPDPSRMEVDHVRAWPLGAIRELEVADAEARAQR